MKIIRSICILLAGFLLISHAYSEVKYYRYKDLNGKIVISSILDPESAKLGYEIINDKGRVVSKVDPVATGADLKTLKAKEQAIIDEKKRVEEQQEFDLSLIRKYSAVADIEAEKKRKLTELKMTLSIVKGNLTSVRSELEAEYVRAATIERNGKPIPDEVKQRIKSVEEVVISTEDLYKLREKEFAKASDDYDRAIKRFQELQIIRGKPLDSNKVKNQ